ncbi:MAG: SIS domain-containing protein [Candidatus Omnitrophota bacterium]|nr:SIS domain-containing protein [Candidatus Omnitrophota bacterium]
MSIKQELIRGRLKNFIELLNSIRVTDKKGRTLDFCDSIKSTIHLIKKRSKHGGKVFFIGNGGSAAIASHMAIDFWKNGKIAAIAFNDPSLLTCISNDFGYAQVFAKPLAFFAHKNDILFAISSSGKSKNILNGARAAQQRRCNIITLSGFNSRNTLRTMGTYNFYVPSSEYGSVEVIHQYICHLILDTIIQKNL